MMKLDLEKSNEGKLFPIPGEFFEKFGIKLRIKVITQDKLLAMGKLTREVKPNKVTGIAYEVQNTERGIKEMNKILREAVTEWEGIEQPLNDENFKKFINVYGSSETGKTLDEESDKMVKQTLSGWIMETCTDASKIIIPDDSENLEITS